MLDSPRDRPSDGGTDAGTDEGQRRWANRLSKSSPSRRHRSCCTASTASRSGLGQEFGVSGWRTVEQDDINTFAKLTGDEQWIHVDPERAATGPFGATVQHGFLTLGMATGLLWEVCTVEGFGVILNYGLNKVRFPAPLRSAAGSACTCEIAEVKELDGRRRGEASTG